MDTQGINYQSLPADSLTGTPLNLASKDTTITPLLPQDDSQALSDSLFSFVAHATDSMTTIIKTDSAYLKINNIQPTPPTQQIDTTLSDLSNTLVDSTKTLIESATEKPRHYINNLPIPAYDLSGLKDSAQVIADYVQTQPAPDISSIKDSATTLINNRDYSQISDQLQAVANIVIGTPAFDSIRTALPIPTYNQYSDILPTLPSPMAIDSIKASLPITTYTGYADVLRTQFTADTSLARLTFNQIKNTEINAQDPLSYIPQILQTKDAIYSFAQASFNNALTSNATFNQFAGNVNANPVISNLRNVANDLLAIPIDRNQLMNIYNSLNAIETYQYRDWLVQASRNISDINTGHVLAQNIQNNNYFSITAGSSSNFVEQALDNNIANFDNISSIFNINNHQGSATMSGVNFFSDLDKQKAKEIITTGGTISAGFSAQNINFTSDLGQGSVRNLLFNKNNDAITIETDSISLVNPDIQLQASSYKATEASSTSRQLNNVSFQMPSKGISYNSPQVTYTQTNDYKKLNLADKATFQINNDVDITQLQNLEISADNIRDNRKLLSGINIEVKNLATLTDNLTLPDEQPYRFYKYFLPQQNYHFTYDGSTNYVNFVEAMENDQYIKGFHNWNIMTHGALQGIVDKFTKNYVRYITTRTDYHKDINHQRLVPNFDFGSNQLSFYYITEPRLHTFGLLWEQKNQPRINLFHEQILKDSPAALNFLGVEYRPQTLTGGSFNVGPSWLNLDATAAIGQGTFNIKGDNIYGKSLLEMMQKYGTEDLIPDRYKYKYFNKTTIPFASLSLNSRLDLPRNMFISPGIIPLPEYLPNVGDEANTLNNVNLKRGILCLNLGKSINPQNKYDIGFCLDNNLLINARNDQVELFKPPSLELVVKAGKFTGGIYGNLDTKTIRLNVMQKIN